MRASKWFPLVLLALAACGGSKLDTRTYQLSYIDSEEAVKLLEPYVFSDRSGAPGRISYQPGRGSITVRETPDNLDKIARMLATYDRPKPNVRLHFQLIQADGNATRDPAIADVEDALRKLFRFKGYRLVGEALAAGMENAELTQTVSAPGGPYHISASIRDVRASGDSGSVRVFTNLWSIPSVPLIQTQITLRSGQTAVLGNAQLGSQVGTLILTVRPELVP